MHRAGFAAKSSLAICRIGVLAVCSTNINSNSTKEEKGTVGLTEQELNAHIIHGNFLNIIF